MRNYKDLQVWEKAHTSQIRRSSASIAANLAEGCGRRSDGEMPVPDFNGFGDRSFPITCYSLETSIS